MITLGNARRSGAMRIAQKAVRKLRDCGEVAVLVGASGDVVLLPHWTPDYTDTLTRRADYLCGVYRVPVDDQPSKDPVTARVVCDDMIDRWRELRGAAA